MQNSQIRLTELYTAVFNRAPDAAGLAYWSGELANGKINLEAIAANWMTSQPEALARYPLSMSSDSFIQEIYANVLNRQPVVSDYTYWGTQLDNGSVSRDAFIAAIINGAKANSSAQGQLDAALLANKAAVGIAFATQGLNDQGLAGEVVKVVDSSLESTRAATAMIQVTRGDFDGLDGALKALAQFLGSAAGASLRAQMVEYLESIAANVSHASRPELFSNITETLNRAIDAPAELASPAAKAEASLAQAGNNDAPQTPVLLGTAAADTFWLPAGTHQARIEGFEPGRDKLSLDEAAGAKVQYRGEANDYANLIEEEFDGTPGQAAMVRATQELVIDVNGDNQITGADIVISMPGIWQLEDYYFV